VSVLVPLCCSQPALTLFSRRFARQFPRKVVWWVTTVEAYSALQRLHREGELNDQQLLKAQRKWETLNDTLLVVEPKERVRDLAVTLPRLYGLRALDSFQLAAALVWCREKPRHRHVCDLELSKKEI
jgi:predicted nucleic acid-binding protein